MPKILAEAHPLVSICIANYNGEAVVEKCLRSLREQVGDVKFEVIVHDDASSDTSCALIREMFPEVKLLVGSENVGFCVANNRMVNIAKGDYVLLLNNDAWLAHDAVQTLVQASHRLGDCIFTLPQFSAEEGCFLDCGMFIDLFANAVPIGEVREQPVAMAMGACLWIPKNVWQLCGGFPDWFGSMGEDMYLCNYARVLGFPVFALADSAYYHHVGHSFGGGKVVNSGLRTTVKRRRLSERNRLFVMFLFYPVLPLMFLLPVSCILLLLEGLSLSLLKRDPRVFSQIYSFAIKGVIRHFGLLYRKRKQVQRQRQLRAVEFFSTYRCMPYKLHMLLRHGIPEIK